MRVKIFVLLAVVAALLAGYVALQHRKPVETVAAISFRDAKGNKVSLDQFKGKPVLVNLWATWCPPCVHELPSLDKLSEKMGDKLAVVAISLDKAPAREVEAFLLSKGVKTLALYIDADRDVQTKWKYEGLPTSYLLDKNGNLIRRYEGPYQWDQVELPLP